MEISLDPLAAGELNRLKLGEREVPKLPIVPGDEPEEEPLLRVELARVPRPRAVGVEELHDREGLLPLPVLRGEGRERSEPGVESVPGSQKDGWGERERRAEGWPGAAGRWRKWREVRSAD